MKTSKFLNMISLFALILTTSVVQSQETFYDQISDSEFDGSLEQSIQNGDRIIYGETSISSISPEIASQFCTPCYPGAQVCCDPDERGDTGDHLQRGDTEEYSYNNTERTKDLQLVFGKTLISELSPETAAEFCEPCGPGGLFCCNSDDRGDDGDW